MTEPKAKDNVLIDKLSIACALIEKRLATIWDAIDAIDTKTNIILGFASVVLVVLVGFFSLEPSRWSTLSLVLFILALISYVVLVILSVLSYQIKGWSYRPEPSTLLKYCKDDKRSLEDISKWIANEVKTAVDTNLIYLEKKAKRTNCVIYLFAAETILLAFGLAFTLLGC